MADIPPSSSAGPPPNSASAIPTAEPDNRCPDSKALDRAFERIRNSNLPPDPYITSVDGSIYSGRAVGYQWTRNSPFAPEEGHLQYQTLYYRDTSASLLRLRAVHEDEAWRKEMAMRANGATVPPPAAKSGANTPLNASSAAKKKISLGDYKSRKEAGSHASTPTAQSQPADLRKETLKRELETSTEPKLVAHGPPQQDEHLGLLNDQSSETQNQAPDSKPDSIPHSRLNKRSVEDTEGGENAKSHPSPSKRIRTTPPPHAPRLHSAKSPSRTAIAGTADTADAATDTAVAPIARASGNSTVSAAPKPLASGQVATPAIHVSTASPTNSLPNKSLAGKSVAQQDPKSTSTPTQAPQDTARKQPSSVLAKKASTSLAQRPSDRVQGERQREAGSYEHESPKLAKRDHEKVRPPTKKSSEASKAQGRAELRDNKLSYEEKGLCSWLPKITNQDEDQDQSQDQDQDQDDRGAWVPPVPPLAIANRTPPTLSSLAGTGPSKQPKSSADSKPPTAPKEISKSSTKHSSAHNQSATKETDVTRSKLPSTPSPEQQPSRPPTKSKGEGTMTKNPDKKASTQTSKTLPNPQNAQELVNGAHKASSTFFRQYETDRKPIGSRPVSTIPSQKEDEAKTAIVKLKYTRARARDVERILRLKPTPRKEPVANAGAGPPQHHSDTSTQRSHERHGSLEQKRPVKRDDDAGPQLDAVSGKRPPNGDRSPQEPTEKRQKTATAASSNTPQTPHRQRLLSPARVTPANHTRHISPSSARIANSTSQDTPTQQYAAASPESSAHADRNAPGGRSRSDSAQGRSPQTLKAEFEKQQGIARALRKKALTALTSLAEPESGDNTTKKKAAAVEGVESVLCFMKAFAAHDRYSRDRIGSIKRWESILPWTREVAQSCDGLPHLHGMSLMLRYLCCAELGAAFTRVNLTEMNSTSPSASSMMMRGVLDNFSNMQRYASDSERLLPRATMASKYPDAYEECSLLPLGMTTDSAVAIKVGYKFLTDWTSQENIPWNQTMDESMLA